MNFTQPKVPVPAGKWEKIFHSASIVLIIMTFMYAALKYASLPDTIPIHFNAQGEVGNWGNKAMIFMLPVISLLLYIMFYFLNMVPHLFNLPVNITEENAARIYPLARMMMAIFNFEMMAIFSYVTWEMINVAQGHSATLDIWFVLVVFVVPLGTIALFIPCMRRRQ
ncbi:Protein of unknown function [Lentibacillus halodurans]|uniref:DUF1648 domain-containing protein n=1 Tax=Lentibacillus halodurans TaxID=237679 RepID=A0A1I0WHG8_9BACI|nr:DUF1648 domain-containing protein [Lentibacillus halodurans]SFA87570.1 Protein of unknown function [Lentibacillus halodurans]